MGRKVYAEYLTSYLKMRTAPEGEDSRSFVLALDAPWGEGKSFFIDRWEQMLRTGAEKHLTLKFDAWTEDIGSDPVIAFMAAFRDVLKSALPLEARADHAIGKQAEKGRRFFKSMTKVVGNALARKALASSVDEIAGIFNGSSDEAAADTAGSDTLRSERIVEEALKDQSERKELIREFKNDSQELIESLATNGNLTLPMFVFIDELDRCRPDFSIAMLEGIKHIFGIRGVCFIVSTNINQLSESVKAVYGSGFSAQAYLKRFFDVTYSLPKPTPLGFIRATLSHYPELKNRTLYFGGGADTFRGIHGDKILGQDFTAETCFEWVFVAFDLDLRSINSIISEIYASIACIPSGQIVHLIWLTILATVRHVDTESFNRLFDTRATISNDEAKKIFQSCTKSRTSLKRTKITDRYSIEQYENISLEETFISYFDVFATPLEVIQKRINDDRKFNHRLTILHLTSASFESRNTKSLPYISQYPNYVRHGAQFSE